MKSTLINILTCMIAVVAMATTVQADVVIGSFEFTDNSLAFTDADLGDGITVSDLDHHSYTLDELFSDNADAVADNTLDYMSLNGVESPNGTGSGVSNGDYFSFTVTNNSGDVLDLRSFTGDFRKNNVFQQFQGRIYNVDVTDPGFDNTAVVDDTIDRLGPNSDGTDTEFVTDDALLDGTGNSGVNFAGVATSIADGTSMTFHWVPNMNSNSTARSMAIDNITVIQATAAIPEPSSMLLIGLASAGLLVSRRRSR